MTARSLTTGEIALAKAVFGTALDYNGHIKIHDTAYDFFQPHQRHGAERQYLYAGWLSGRLCRC